MVIIVFRIIVLMKPYNHEVLNKFDGIVLQLINVITALSLFDDFDSLLVIIISL